MEVDHDQKTKGYSARPELGQLVAVRRRQWVMADAASSKLESASASQNCVTLSSVDEDSLGEELKIIREIKPGAQLLQPSFDSDAAAAATPVTTTPKWRIRL